MTSPARNHHATTDTEPLLPGTHAAEPEWPITTWQGWQHFATTPPLAPPQPGHTPRGAEERLAYHSAFVTVRTPAINTLATQVRTLMLLGRHQQTTARPSLIVTGPAAAGKTTALLEVGRTCHLPTPARTRPRPDVPTSRCRSRTCWCRPAPPPRPSPSNSPATSASPSPTA
ncbi:hypothetical protein [Streptomyces antibioticus]|uniref:hypothetical protein n=1 Tax=Streptomyces antibioticus TaxID=1890 RepID=UPI003D6B93A4